MLRSVDTIYVATDNERILKKIDEWSLRSKPGFSKWNFVYNKKARRSNVKTSALTAEEKESQMDSWE